MSDPMSVALIVVVGVLFVRLAGLDRRVRSLGRLEAKVNALIRHAGIDFDPYREVPDPVMDAIRRGKKIEAIKHYRAATGAGLAEAKEFVEEVQRRCR